jgi:hypothetical protein
LRDLHDIVREADMNLPGQLPRVVDDTLCLAEHAAAIGSKGSSGGARRRGLEPRTDDYLYCVV